MESEARNRMSLPYMPALSSNADDGESSLNADNPRSQDEDSNNHNLPQAQKFTFSDSVRSEDQIDTDCETSSPIESQCTGTAEHDGNENNGSDAESQGLSVDDDNIPEAATQNYEGQVDLSSSLECQQQAAMSSSSSAEARSPHPPKYSKKSSSKEPAMSVRAFSSAVVRERGYNPTVGSVIEAGQETTGRWTKEEHEAFLVGLKMYGKEWKKVAARVGTRTVVQTRTHAQKYFQKLHKIFLNGEVDLAELSGLDAGEFAVVAESLGTTINFKAANKGQGVSIKRTKREELHHGRNNEDVMTFPTLPGEEQQHESKSKMLSKIETTQGHKKTSTTEQPTSNLKKQLDALPPRPAVVDLGADRFGALVTMTTDNMLSSNTISKINSPTRPDKLQGFPPPSPAACGKRKLAELAVAQMLAGVMSSSSSGGKAIKTEDEMESSAQQEVASCPKTPVFTHDTVHKAAVNEPQRVLSSSKIPHLAEKVASSQDNIGDSFLTPKPPFSIRNSSPSLQIVNPDSLGGSLSRRKYREGLDSPFTPWDGQLKALVSDSKIKDKSSQDPDVVAVSSKLKEKGDSNSYHPLTWNEIESRPLIHQAISSGNVNKVAEILNQPRNLNKSGNVFDNATDMMSDLSQSDSEKQQEKQLKLDEQFLEDVGIGFIPGRSMLSSEPFEKIIPHSICDSQNFTPLHVAASLDFAVVGPGIPAEITRMLLAAGADVRCIDKFGNTALHWAARSGNGDVAHLLTLKNCALDAKNLSGETALHWAMRAGRRGQSAVRVLIEDGARANIANKSFRTPLDVAAAGFNFEARKKPMKKTKAKPEKIDLEMITETRCCRANLFACSPSSRTLVLHHPECLEHIPKSESDWECPDRITSILSKLTEARDEVFGSSFEQGDFSESFRFSPREITVSTDFQRASLELISRVHSAEYLDFVNELSKTLERRQKEETGDSPSIMTIPFTPHIQRNILKTTDLNVKGHSDTSFSVGSLRAARRAAGAVQHAVDRVLSGRSRNAFCVVRPPGHHAGVNGLLENSESCGFCIFNNVATGALHALSERHQVRCGKVAIVDIDVHHGNGTEEIVRRAHDSTRIFFFSVHLYDNPNATTGKYSRGPATKEWSFYPGTGDKDDMAHNIINVPLAPLWKEKEVATATTNGAALSSSGSVHNTRNRAKKEAAATSKKEGKADGEGFASESDQSSKKISPGKTGAINEVPTHYLFGAGRKGYRRAIRTRLIPSLRAFNPDLILISAGFDACSGDVGNAKHMAGGKERAGIDLDPEDYAWTTRKVMEVADICCHGRVVSVLEGGYGRTRSDRLSATSAKSSSVLDKSVFSESVMRHLRSLIDPYDSEKRHPRQIIDEDDSGDEN